MNPHAFSVVVNFRLRDVKTWVRTLIAADRVTVAA